MNTPSSSAILDAALARAERSSWERVRLADVAEELGISLDDIRARYAQKEDLVAAWFDRADRAMLQQAAASDFIHLGSRERLERVMMSWMEALAPHQKVTREMILGQLEPGHLHIQWAGVLRISRTVQWMREAARRDAGYLNRALEETLLTSIYLLTFARWLTDDSKNFLKTRRHLRNLLARSRWALRLTGGSTREE